MKSKELLDILDKGVTLAKAAGRMMQSAGHDREIAKKGRIDLVTDADIAINQFLCDELSSVDKSMSIIAEEGVPKHLHKPQARFCWVIDPIDGTTNFVHGLMHSAVSVALYDNNEQRSVLGIVHNPFRNECFTAIKGGGAFLNDTPLKVSATDQLIDSLISTGFAYHDMDTRHDNNMTEFAHIMKMVQGMRRLGSASLDLAYVACGRFDGYFESGIKFWDYAAGMLLVEEAGGTTSTYDGSRAVEKSGHIIAANPAVYPALLAAIIAARKGAGFSIVPG